MKNLDFKYFVKSQIANKCFRNKEKKSLNQCDILHDVSIPTATDYLLDTKQYQIAEYNLDYGVIINQDCNLNRDYENRHDPKAENQDKVLPNILILPAYQSEEFRSGNHRGNLKGNSWNSSQFRQINKNQNLRFDFIDKNEDLQVPELIIDFKHAYTLNTKIAYKFINEIYHVSISELFRENISNRYAYYIGRIRLPPIN